MNHIALIAFLEDVLELEKDILTISTHLNDLPQWDSMGKLTLIVEISQRLNKKLTNDEIKSFITIEDILDFINL
jgi:acyl carrier protein